jgi:hypothetical protein
MLNFIRSIVVVSFLFIVIFANNSISRASDDWTKPCLCQGNIQAKLYTNGPCMNIRQLRNNLCIFSFYRTQSLDNLLGKYQINPQKLDFRWLYQIYSAEPGTDKSKYQGQLYELFMAIFVYSLPYSLTSDELEYDPQISKYLIKKLPKGLLDNFKKYRNDIVKIFLGIVEINIKYFGDSEGSFAVGKGCLIARNQELSISIAADKSIINGVCKFNN